MQSLILDPHRADAETIEQDSYDAVIVGSGIAGAIIAKQLCEAGKRVLLVEAAADTDASFDSYNTMLDRFFTQPSRDNQSPFAVNPDAPMPRSGDLRQLRAGETNAASYIVQDGPYVSDTVYSRALGGTTIHWEAKTPRMLPEDFAMRSRFEQGRNWPLSYDELEPWYEAAEREIGVSADVDDQRYLDMRFRDGYVFPMHGLPLSYLDRQVAKGIAGLEVELYGEKHAIGVRPFPQGRNAIPNADYANGRGFQPVGAVASHQIDIGGRCQGNTNCVPICPVQAKYHAGKTLAKAFATGRLRYLAQAVASKVLIHSASRRVRGIETKIYRHPGSAEHRTVTLTGDIYVLAANAIETPRLLLASGLPSTSRLVGRKLMDHAYLLNWALMPQVCGTMRGTSCTGGIVDLRGGAFRRHQAAFSVDIHNDGWGWATGAPESDLLALVDRHNRFGKELRQGLIDRVSRQLMLAFMIEMMPDESNGVSVDPSYTDALGNMRPKITLTMSDYTMRGAAYARRFAKTVFARLGAADHTRYDPADYGFRSHDGAPYAIRGGNHLAGTHVMGTCRSNSVVDADQKSWDHDNLYLVGGGSMPTIGTANVTLTLAALCLRTAEAMKRRMTPATANTTPKRRAIP